METICFKCIFTIKKYLRHIYRPLIITFSFSLAK